MALNATLATAGHSLDVFSAGIQVAGQNVSNASTPGYIREELLLDPGATYRSGSLILGTGVVATGVQQQIDQYLEQRIHAANADVSTSTVKNNIYKQLEGEIQELSDKDLSTSFTNFLDAIQNLSAQPESASSRDLTIQQGTQLATDIRSLYQRVDDIRQSQTDRASSLVSEANDLIGQIDKLNKQIVKLESAGLSTSDAGAARSERYQALSRLSEILPIQYREQANGSVDVFTDSDYLVLSGSTQQLQVVGTGTGTDGYRIELSKTGHNIARAGGELAGVIEGRDNILGGFLNNLDDLTGNLIYQFNQLHASGEGLKGYTSIVAQNQVDDTAVPLNQSSLPFAPTHGSFNVKIVNQQTGLAETTTIPVDLDGIGSDTSLEDLRSALDAVGNLTATISPRGELQLQTAAGYEVRFSNDTSGTLAALGINTFFTGKDASSIDVSNLLKSDSDYLATGQGGGPSDGRNINGFSDFLEQPVDGLDGKSLTGFYQETITQLAQDSAGEQALESGLATFRDSLKNQQQQFTGVSLDEEAIKVLELQRGYQASARVISTVNELLTTLLNM